MSSVAFLRIPPLVLEAQLALVEDHGVDRRVHAHLRPRRLVVQPGPLRLLVDEEGVQLDLELCQPATEAAVWGCVVVR